MPNFAYGVPEKAGIMPPPWRETANAPGSMPGASLGGYGYGLPPQPAVAPNGLPGFAGGVDPMLQMQMAWQVEMLRVMKKLSKARGGDDDSNDDGNGSKTTKAFDAMERIRRRYERTPDKVIQEYVGRVRRELGINSGAQYYQMTDFTKRLMAQFGKLRGLLRMHFAVSEALQEWVNGRHHHVGASLCLILQSLHQCALDGGSWQSAQLMLPGPDYLGRPEFGGDFVSMTGIAAYRKALKDLKQQHGVTEQDHEEGEAHEAGTRRRGKDKAKEKGKGKGGGKDV
jgi:hypothetical protein